MPRLRVRVQLARRTHQQDERPGSAVALAPCGAARPAGSATRVLGFSADVDPAARISRSLQHLCATVLPGAGVPAQVVMEVLGHSQIPLRMNTYSDVLSGWRTSYGTFGSRCTGLRWLSMWLSASGRVAWPNGWGDGLDQVAEFKSVV